jgi:hypothetical protein
VIASFLFGLAVGAAQAADFSTLRGEITDPPPEATTQSGLSVGLRYWYSVGRHDYAHDASMFDPTVGNPTSELLYKNIPAHAGELFARYSDDETGLVVKGFAGGGGFADGGTMNDRDWFIGQRLFSNTDSSLKNSNLRYATIDFGGGAEYLTFGRLQVLPFIGYGYWRDAVGSWGLTFLPDDFGGAFAAAPPGTVLFSNRQKVGDYVASWNMARVGAEATVSILPQLTLTVDGAILPYVQGSGDDSHLLRQDQLGAKPNVFIRGHGWGAQVDAMLRYQVSSNFSLGVGGRYWYVEAPNGTNTNRTLSDFGISFPLTRFSSERYGLLADAAYKF